MTWFSLLLVLPQTTSITFWECWNCISCFRLVSVPFAQNSIWDLNFSKSQETTTVVLTTIDKTVVLTTISIEGTLTDIKNPAKGTSSPRKLLKVVFDFCWTAESQDIWNALNWSILKFGLLFLLNFLVFLQISLLTTSMQPDHRLQIIL